MVPSVVTSIFVGIATAVMIELPVLRLRDRWFPSRTRSTSVDVKENAVQAKPVLSAAAGA